MPAKTQRRYLISSSLHFILVYHNHLTNRLIKQTNDNKTTMNAPNYNDNIKAKDLADYVEIDANKDSLYGKWITLKNPGGSTKEYAFTAEQLKKIFPNKIASKFYSTAHHNMRSTQCRALAYVRERLNKSQDGTGLTAIMAGLHINNDEVSDVSMAQTDTDDISAVSAMSMDTTINKTTASKAVGQGLRGRMQSIAEDKEVFSRDNLELYAEKFSVIKNDEHLTEDKKASLHKMMADDMQSDKAALGERIKALCDQLEESTKKIEKSSEYDRFAAIKDKETQINNAFLFAGW